VVSRPNWSAAIASAAEAERAFWQKRYLQAGVDPKQAAWMAIERGLYIQGLLLESARRQGVFIPGSDTVDEVWSDARWDLNAPEEGDEEKP
jgi:hypothetical protein